MSFYSNVLVEAIFHTLVLCYMFFFEIVSFVIVNQLYQIDALVLRRHNLIYIANIYCYDTMILYNYIFLMVIHESLSAS